MSGVIKTEVVVRTVEQGDGPDGEYAYLDALSRDADNARTLVTARSTDPPEARQLVDPATGDVLETLERGALEAVEDADVTARDMRILADSDPEAPEAERTLADGTVVAKGVRQYAEEFASGGGGTQPSGPYSLLADPTHQTTTPEAPGDTVFYFPGRFAVLQDVTNEWGGHVWRHEGSAGNQAGVEWDRTPEAADGDVLHLTVDVALPQGHEAIPRVYQYSAPGVFATGGDATAQGAAVVGTDAVQSVTLASGPLLPDCAIVICFFLVVDAGHRIDWHGHTLGLGEAIPVSPEADPANAASGDNGGDGGGAGATPTVAPVHRRVGASAQADHATLTAALEEAAAGATAAAPYRVVVEDGVYDEGEIGATFGHRLDHTEVRAEHHHGAVVVMDGADARWGGAAETALDGFDLVGTCTFEGLVIDVENVKYPFHVDRANDGPADVDPDGVGAFAMRFRRVHFRHRGGAAAGYPVGVGLGAGQHLALDDCTYEGTAPYGVFAHNRASQGAPCSLRVTGGAATGGGARGAGVLNLQDDGSGQADVAVVDGVGHSSLTRGVRVVRSGTGGAAAADEYSWRLDARGPVQRVEVDPADGSGRAVARAPGYEGEAPAAAAVLTGQAVTLGRTGARPTPDGGPVDGVALADAASGDPVRYALAGRTAPLRLAAGQYAADAYVGWDAAAGAWASGGATGRAQVLDQVTLNADGLGLARTPVR